MIKKQVPKLSFDKELFKRSVLYNIKTLYRKTLEEATPQQIFQAVSYAVKDTIVNNWMDTQKEYEKRDVKIVYYMSMEFLMGRALGNNMINLKAYKQIGKALEELGVDLNVIEDQEPDAALGNGGLGSCFFCNGRAHLGVEGYAGEFGHTCYKVGGRKCSCGQEGCLEAYVSARGMIQTAREILDQHPEMDSMLRRMPEMTMKIMKQACEMEDQVALETVRYTSRILGMKLANYASIVDPEAVILTGELTMFGKWMMPDLRACFEENVFHNSRDKIELLFSDFDEGERDILGASALAWTVKKYSLFK